MADLTIEFRPDEGHWVVEDYTSDDYSTYRFKSVWDEDYNLVEFWLDRKRAEKVLEDGRNSDNKRCKLAYSRHQKKLLQTTGVIEAPDPQTLEYFIINNQFLKGIPQIQQMTAERVTQKQIKTRNWNFDKAQVFYTQVTPEKAELVKEYNEAIEEFMRALGNLRKEIFGTRCSGCGDFSTNHQYVVKNEDWPDDRRRWEKHDREFDSFTCYDLFTRRNGIEQKPHHKIT